MASFVKVDVFVKANVSAGIFRDSGASTVVEVINGAGAGASSVLEEAQF